MTNWKLALRNLRRNSRRSITTILTTVVGLAALLLFGGYRSNIQYGSLTGFVQYTGHLQIQVEGYFKDGGDNPLDYGIENYAAIIAKIKQDAALNQAIAVITPNLQLGGIAGNFSAGISRSVLAFGLEPEAYNHMLRWNEFAVTSYAQSLPLSASNSDKVVLGTGVARRLRMCQLLAGEDCSRQTQASSKNTNASQSSSGIRPELAPDIAALAQERAATPQAAPGQQIELLAASQRGAPNVASLQVVAAQNKGIKALDDLYLAMHLQQAQALVYGKENPKVTAILVQLHKTADLPWVQQKLQQLLRQASPSQTLEVLDFATLNPIYGQTNQFMDTMFGFIALLIGVIVLFTVANTMSAAIIERTHEIGTLRALGMRRNALRSLFLREATLLGGAGCLLGLLTALAIAWLINHSGWTWTPPGYSYAYLVQVRISDDLSMLAQSSFWIMLITLLSAWWPAQRAARMQVVEALRHH